MTIILGIDPGKDGGAALLGGTGLLYQPLSFKYCEDYPLVLHSWCELYSPQVFMEQTHAMPGQGVVSMHTFGYHKGLAEGAVRAAGLDINYFEPEFWQMYLELPMYRHLPDASKRRTARRRAQKEQALLWYPKLADARGDIWAAVLIAHAGLKQLQCAHTRKLGTNVCMFCRKEIA